jgi:potassium-transporting ATPase KdpC subunit
MLRQLKTAIIAFVALTVLTGVIYPLAVTGVAQLAFHSKAEGSLLTRDGVVVGSALIGQQFTGARYFHPRPSAAGGGYDAVASGAANLGPSNPELLRTVTALTRAYCIENHLSASTPVPIDAVTSSGSGLDPQISPQNARLQASRVAAARGLPLAVVLALVSRYTQPRSLGFLGEPGVNVLELNLALDRLR